MNRRFRASELSLHEVERNLQPVGNVDRITSPGGSDPSSGSSGDDLDVLRRDALEAMHNYVVAATDFNLPRSMTVFRRVLWTLDSHLGREAERSR